MQIYLMVALRETSRNNQSFQSENWTGIIKATISIINIYRKNVKVIQAACNQRYHHDV